MEVAYNLLGAIHTVFGVLFDAVAPFASITVFVALGVLGLMSVAVIAPVPPELDQEDDAMELEFEPGSDQEDHTGGLDKDGDEMDLNSKIAQIREQLLKQTMPGPSGDDSNAHR